MRLLFRAIRIYFRKVGTQNPAIKMNNIYILSKRICPKTYNKDE